MASIITSDNTTDSIDYKIWQKIESCMLMQEYTYEDIANKVREIKQIMKYRCEDEDSEIENETLSLMERFKSQESRDELSALIESLAKMLVDKAGVKKAEEIRIAKVLVKKGVSVDVISQATGLSTEEFA